MAKQATSDEWVSLIASGYEWDCPHCGHECNKEIAYTGIVTCKECGESFQTCPPNHAFE
jgi:transcription elongation factor Elf1